MASRGFSVWLLTAPQHSLPKWRGNVGRGQYPTAMGEPTALCRGPQPAAQVGIGAVVAMCFGVVTLLTAKGSNDHAAGVARPGELGIHPSPVKPNMFYGTGKRRSVNNSFCPC